MTRSHPVTTLTDLKIWDGRQMIPADTIQWQGQLLSFIGSKGDLPATTNMQSCAGLTAMPTFTWS